MDGSVVYFLSLAQKANGNAFISNCIGCFNTGLRTQVAFYTYFRSELEDRTWSRALCSFLHVLNKGTDPDNLQII